MGKKSSAKAQQRETSTTGSQPPTEGGGKTSTGMVVGAIVALVAVAGGFAYVRNGHDATAPADHSAHAQSAAAPAADSARWAKFGPHKQATYPALPTQEYAPPRPMNVVRDAYLFAAEHPEILSYVPCFCGCERGGHKGNHDCFVAARNDQGDVTAWEPHGLECTVCIDVATEARQMFSSGAGVRDIRAAVEKKWAGFNGGHTPTPPAPSKAN